MNVLLKNIKSWLSKRAVKKSIHYENIKNGECLIVDGKKYVKVKLKFVDSLDYKVAKKIHFLESEVSLLNDLVKELHEKLSSAESKIASLQILNINLVNEHKAKMATSERNITSLSHQKLMTVNRKLIAKNKEQKFLLRNMKELHQILKDDARKHKEEFEGLKNKILRLPIKYKTGSKGALGNRLNDKINELTLEINSLQDIIVQHEHLSRKLLEDLHEDEW